MEKVVTSLQYLKRWTSPAHVDLFLMPASEQSWMTVAGPVLLKTNGICMIGFARIGVRLVKKPMAKPQIAAKSQKPKLTPQRLEPRML
ncbi:MAG: hypothetical protein CFE43_21105 [Burkholderiales bacterium PBB3]|nr:MAG: hypothetical protein CFE43_21105 [Burkholderiales bacterium PBB3]